MAAPSSGVCITLVGGEATVHSLERGTPAHHVSEWGSMYGVLVLLGAAVRAVEERLTMTQTLNDGCSDSLQCLLK